MIISKQNNMIVNLSDNELSNDQILDEIKKIDVNNEISFLYLGKRDYVKAWELQNEVHTLVKNHKISNIVLYLEHNHVYTLGKNADTNFILNNYPNDVSVIETDRGGQVTYHGPGQLVGYPIINLNNYKKSISWYMRSLEKIIILTLRDYGLPGNRKDGMTGVWIEDEKICAMGVRISRWVSMHGFALNLKPEMKYYDGMIPCGIQEFGITSLYELLKYDIDINDVMKNVTKNFLKVIRIQN